MATTRRLPALRRGADDRPQRTWRVVRRVRFELAVILYCRLCATGYGSTGEVPARCPSCQRETKWGSSPPRAVDAFALALTDADRRMLRGLKIDPE